MNDIPRGEELGGKVENLRRVAAVYLPRMANDYNTLTGHLSSTTGSESAFQRSGEFGPMAVKSAWTSLRDLLWTSSDQTSDNLFGLASGLKGAVEGFVAQDDAAAQKLAEEKQKFENDKGAAGHEWNKPYQNDQTAPKWEEPIPPGVGGN